MAVVTYTHSSQGLELGNYCYGTDHSFHTDPQELHSTHSGHRRAVCRVDHTVTVDTSCICAIILPYATHTNSDRTGTRGKLIDLPAYL